MIRQSKWRRNEVLICMAIVSATGALISCSGRSAKGRIEASGVIEARQVRVASKTTGQILELRVDEGGAVKSSDVLAVIDHESLDIQLRQAEAGVSLAASQLALLRAGARSEDIRQGEEVLKQAEAFLKTAVEDTRRMRELAKRGSVTPKQKEDAEARLTVAEAQSRAAAEALAKLRRLARPEEIKASEARLAQSEASVDLLRKTIADCTVLSPVSGIVTERPIEAGELATPGTAVMVISELSKVHLMIYVSEKELGSVRLGQAADVRIDSAPGRIFRGVVTFISPVAEFTPKNIQTKEDRVKLVFGVKVEIENPDGTLKPGLPADAVLEIAPAASKG